MRAFLIGVMGLWLVGATSDPAWAVRLVARFSPDPNPPYHNGEKRQAGIAIDIIRALSQETGYSIEVRYLPLRRHLMMIQRGEIDLELPVVESWRLSSGINDVVMYSDILFTDDQVLISAAGKPIQIQSLDQLNNQTLATVSGYDYLRPWAFNRDDHPTPASMILDVAKGNAPIGIGERNTVLRIARSLGVNVEIGPVWGRLEYRIMLHKNRANLLPELNAAIARLRKSGEIDAIVARGLAQSDIEAAQIR